MFKMLTGPGGHPELGDTVYDKDDEPVGTIQFFHSQVRPDVWAIETDKGEGKILVVERRPVMVGMKMQGAMLTLLDEPFRDTNSGGARAQVMIQNNSPAPETPNV